MPLFHVYGTRSKGICYAVEAPSAELAVKVLEEPWYRHPEVEILGEREVDYSEYETDFTAFPVDEEGQELDADEDSEDFDADEDSEDSDC